jgi:hypothetical protein
VVRHARPPDLSNQTADFNGAAGSQVQLVTKRGTNQFHGALYEYFYASNVGAAAFGCLSRRAFSYGLRDAPATGQGRPVLRKNKQPGGSFSLPPGRVVPI